MDETILWTALVFVLGTGALGLYVMLPSDRSLPAASLRWVGPGLCGLSPILLVVLIGPRISWWPESENLSPVTLPLSYLFGMVMLSAVVMVVVSPTVSRCGSWFAGLLFVESAFLSFCGAGIVALMVLLTIAIAVCVSRLKRVRSRASEIVGSPDRWGHEPLLACAVGTLMAVMLVGAIHYSLATGSGDDAEQMARLARQRREEYSAALDTRKDSSGEKRFGPQFAPLGETFMSGDGYIGIGLATLLLTAVAATVFISSSDSATQPLARVGRDRLGEDRQSQASAAPNDSDSDSSREPHSGTNP